MLQVAVDTKQLERAIDRLAMHARVAPGKVMEQETKYLVREFIRFTPPKNSQQGKNAVKGDMQKLALQLDASKLAAKATKGGFYRSIARLVRRRQTDKLNELFRNPNIGFYHGRTLVGSLVALRSKHYAHRNRRGRISKGGQFLAAYGRDWRQLRTEVMGRVGWTLAGWQPLARHVGISAKPFSKRLASKAGSARVNFGRDPFVIADNFKVKIPNYQRVVDDAVRSRTRTTNLKIERLLLGQAVNLGFARVSAS